MKKILLFLFATPIMVNAQTTDLLISEYAEGSSNNKYLEIYNGTGADVDLANYAISNCTNGCDVANEFDYPNNLTWTAGTMLADGDVYMIVHPSADASLLAIADETFSFLSNGDDAYALVEAGGDAVTYTIVDILGDLTVNPGPWNVGSTTNGTQNYTLVRKETVCSPNPVELASFGTDDPSSEWTVYPQDEWSYADAHTTSCVAGCNITASGLANVSCNDNGTSLDDADDFISFDLNPTGNDLGANYTVSVSVGTVTPTTGTYGSTTSFQLQDGSAGAGDVTITIIDDVDGGCTLDEIITDPGVCSSAAPVIETTPDTLSGFDHVVGTPSAEQTFEISGYSLTADVVLTAEANYEISETSGTGFTNTISLTPTSGDLSATTIYVRGNATAMGVINEFVLAESIGAVNDTVYVEGYADDYVTYPVGDVTTVDADGVADSLGVMVRLIGTVHCMDFDGDAGYSMTIIDTANDGINVFNYDDVSGYTAPAEGDSIEVFGTIDQYNGLTQVFADSIYLLGSAATQTPTVVTMLDESTESQMITLENLNFVTPITTFPTGSNNIDVTDGTNTFTLRIDADTDIPGSDAPQVTFSVTGVGGQFDSSSPYDGGYQLFPCSAGSFEPSCSTPDVSVTQDDPILTADAAGLQYEWIDCTTGMATGETGQSFDATPHGNGDYKVIITDGECVDTSACYSVIVDGINENSLEKFVTAFPNPVKEELTLTSKTAGELSVKITAIDGAIVEELELKNAKIINTQQWNQGVYFVNFTDNTGENYTVKIVK